MDIMKIIWPVGSLAALGLLFGAALAFASQKFAVAVDSRAEAIDAVLPQANCGGCGYPGCANYAQAVVDGEAIDLCSVGGLPVATEIAKIMGVETIGSGQRMVAKVKCNGGTNCKDDFHYQGQPGCLAKSMVAGGPKACKDGCIGDGDCVAVCKFDAIHINDHGVAQVDADKCVACKMCIAACPKGIIGLVPDSNRAHVLCSNKERGPQVKANCSVACIACGLCVKACKFDAIHVIDNLSRVDYDKCVNCMQCTKVCPTKAIEALIPKRRRTDPRPTDVATEAGVSVEE